MRVMKWPQTRVHDIVEVLCHDGIKRNAQLGRRIGRRRWVGNIWSHHNGQPGKGYHAVGRVRMKDDGTFTFKMKDKGGGELPPPSVENVLCSM